MLLVTLIGNLGANAEVKVADGREFVTFRVAHNDSYTDAQGNKVVRSNWVDCTMSCTGGRPAVLPYLQRGTLVCVVGSLSTRVYSSEKDHCMKAGLTIHVSRIELLGGQSDPVPRRLYDDQGAMHEITKYFFVADMQQGTLMDVRGARFLVEKGWVSPVAETETTKNNELTDANGEPKAF